MDISQAAITHKTVDLESVGCRSCSGTAFDWKDLGSKKAAPGETAGKRGGGGPASTLCRAGLMGGTEVSAESGAPCARLACAMAAAAEAAATATCGGEVQKHQEACWPAALETVVTAGHQDVGQHSIPGQPCRPGCPIDGHSLLPADGTMIIGVGCTIRG